MKIKTQTERERDFIDAYHKATGVFNNFFGPLMMLANNAYNEAYDFYEVRPEFKFIIKRNFKYVGKAFDKWWKDIRIAYDDKYSIYIDYCTHATNQLEEDFQKMYWSTKASLMKINREDSARLAWIIVCHLLLGQAVYIFKRFCNDIYDETKMRLLPKAFAWANPTNTEHLVQNMLDSVCQTQTIQLDENVILALKIISQRLLNHDWQDRAAIETLKLDDYKEQREELKDDIEFFERRMEQKRIDEAKQNEAYKQRKAEERQRQRNAEHHAQHDFAEILSTKYNVTRI